MGALKISPNLKIASINLETKELGIENIKESFTLTMDLFKGVIEISKKPSWGAAGRFAWSLLEHGNIIDLFKKALKEFGDLDESEATEIRIFMSEKFDIENDKLEEVIEKSLYILERWYKSAPAIVGLVGDTVDYIAEVKSFIKAA